MSILDDAKQIGELIKKYNDQDLYERIIALREEILALREENIALKETVRDLETTADVSGKLVRKGNAYYFKDDTNNENPYCITCWDSDHKLVGLIRGKGMHGSTIKCQICVARKK